MKEIDIDLGSIESHSCLLWNDAFDKNNVRNKKKETDKLSMMEDRLITAHLNLFVCLLRLLLSMGSGEGQNIELKANIYYGHKFSTCGIYYFLASSHCFTAHITNRHTKSIPVS